MKEYIITKKDSGQRADKYLFRFFGVENKNFIYKMIRKKNIVLNDKKMTGSEILKEDDSLKLWLSDETIEKFSKKNASNDKTEINRFLKAYSTLKGIEVLYEDENFLILNKPQGILSQRSNDNDLSVNDWIPGYLLNNRSIDIDDLINCRPSIVNRLDRNTSGILLAGKTVYGLNVLSSMVKDRTIKKYYITYALGNISGSGVLEGYLHKDEAQNKVNIIDNEKYMSLSEKERASYSYIKTAYEALDIITIPGMDKTFTKLCIDLITGRSHQIRAHFSHMGHPLLGDNKYGDPQINTRLHLKHQLLHAYRVVFPVDDRLIKLSGREITCLHGNPEVFEDLFSKSW